MLIALVPVSCTDLLDDKKPDAALPSPSSGDRLEGLESGVSSATTTTTTTTSGTTRTDDRTVELDPKAADETNTATEPIAQPETIDNVVAAAIKTETNMETSMPPPPSPAKKLDNLIDVEDPDDYLMYLEPILTQIHTRFYDHYDNTKSVCEFDGLR